MEAASFPSVSIDEVVTCDSCGRAPARPITVRRHVGLLLLQQFVKAQVVACRPCGRALIRSYTLRTLWQGWWGAISFFVNWFVLAANALSWRKLGQIEAPSLSGELVADAPQGFFGPEGESSAKPRSRLRTVALAVFAGFLLLGFLGWAWDASHHDHDGAHGRPVPVAMLEGAMGGDPFIMEDGSQVFVTGARCRGDGEALTGGFTHFTCQLAFANGDSDEVLVHVLEGDELLFKSALGGSR